LLEKVKLLIYSHFRNNFTRSNLISLIYFLFFIQYSQRAFLIKDSSSTKQEYDENLVIDLVNDLNEYLVNLDLANSQISIT